MYVKFPNVTEPFACVATVAAAWQLSHTAPAPVERRQVRPVRVAHQRVRQRVVALRAAVRPAADRRAPGVRR